MSSVITEGLVFSVFNNATCRDARSVEQVSYSNIRNRLICPSVVHKIYQAMKRAEEKENWPKAKLSVVKPQCADRLVTQKR
jgi:hypothetical protein